MTAQRWLAVRISWLALVWLIWLFGGSGCGAPPAPSPPATIATQTETKTALGRRRTDIPDDCDEVAGQPPPEPLRAQYTGVAKAARCQREVYTIMGGVTHFLGVTCKHCHLEPDYAADTHNKQVANWMARELVPRLARRVADAGGERDVWCRDCHAGKPKLLGNPRKRDVAVEWMTTHLTEDFQTLTSKPPKCKDCHGGDLGSAEFRTKVILEDLPGLPAPALPPPASAATETSPSPSPPPSTSAAPVPDFGKR